MKRIQDDQFTCQKLFNFTNNQSKFKCFHHIDDD